ncbi:uncharacterized protein M421DRAFT_55686 [Didymella exigua CBS 183.55]|uniref:C2H2-type domain-containing protein n=1 Tax=Didymella exigua CBS 183.55 TaxID=1150837 RepID=A0A6A5RVP2_9PLEO|nr:uncharacterized protein M421DRAFT_55686 [Didymella exigua CBS 183.55]KAF1931942.1 hypothetical protein M421DRAFT_55686 [Didymella exigua CBS 183.55]
MSGSSWPQCPDLSTRPTIRRRHRQIRKCPECCQIFSKAEHLERHVRSHTKEKPFNCYLCPKAYSRKWVPINRIEAGL